MKKIIGIALMAVMAVFTACEGPMGPPGRDGLDGHDGRDGIDADSPNSFVTEFKVEGDAWKLVGTKGAPGSYWQSDAFYVDKIDDWMFDNAVFVVYIQHINDDNFLVKDPLPFVYYGVNPNSGLVESYTYTYDIAPPSEKDPKVPGSVVFRMLVADGATDKLEPPTSPMYFYLHSVDFGYTE